MASKAFEEELDNLNDSDASIAEYQTSIIDRINSALFNERWSPELLEFQLDLTKELTEKIEEQLEEMKKNLPENEEERTRKSLFVKFQQMEVDRLSYSLRSYFRTRLLKIEQQISSIKVDEEYRERLSDKEKEYADRYWNLLEKHFNDSFLQNLSNPRLRSLTDEQQENLVVRPNFNRYVIIRAKEALGLVEVDVDLGQTVDIKEGDVLLVRYEPVQDLLMEGKIELLG
eukprot:TRINITY_DN1752_c0_g1_i1.p1 TRINITY_DN1752_c0_g1~~TRINITY_DN1752_c0_g1_i1.p1  ORF type:complete len:258 (+),score=68.07 TRINITY_DN1752_c0_g1_i1:90-776(+)